MKRKKIFYKIFIYFCLAAYLPLALIYAFNFFYVDKYIVEDKKNSLIKVAENIDIAHLKRIKKEDVKYGENKLDVYLRYIDLNEKSGSTDFFKFFNKTEIKIDIRKMKLNDYDIKTVKLSSLTNHFFLIKKISDHEIIVAIGEIISSKVVTAIIIGIYKRYSLFIIPILLVVSYIIAKKFSKPIEILEKVSTQISNSDFTEKIDIKSKNELETLGNNINKIANRLKINIEELNNLNEKLKVELKEKERLLETEKMFMRTIGHELKTPIAIINGYIEALQDGLIEDSEVGNTYDIIYQEAMSIDKLVKDINSYLKYEFRDLKPKFEKINIKKIIESGLNKYSLDIEQKNINLEIKLENLSVITDVKIFNIVLNNLITNAITYVDSNKNIGVFLKNNVLIIENSASEITEEMIEKIFNPFYKIDSSRSRKYGGTGLGLSIVKNLLEVLKLEYKFTYDIDRKVAKFIIFFSEEIEIS